MRIQRRSFRCVTRRQLVYKLQFFTFIMINGHMKASKQRTITQQYGDWYTNRWWMGCYIWYSEEGPRRAAAPHSPLPTVPNVTAHPSTASIPTSYYSPPTTEEVYVFVRTPAFVCLSVCKITQKRVHGFGLNVACRQMSGHGRTD